MKKDQVQKELVAATNDSSIKSKRSMVRLGYFNDRFGRAFVPHPSRRSPLINRGYYIRAKSVSTVIEQFLNETKDHSRQIISVGAGFDTTFFRLEDNKLLNDNDKFFEIDFPSVMQRKVEIIKKTKDLNNLAPYLINIPQIQINKSKNQIKKDKKKKNKQEITKDIKIEYSKGKYVPIGCDLACMDEFEKLLLIAGIDKSKSTLILSECVLTYMFPDTSSNIISWGSSFSNVIFLMYEQSFPNDGFGHVMTKHFKKIGSPLRSINEYSSIELYKKRFLSLKYENVNIHDLNDIYYNVLSNEERLRVENLEPFDEYEEWHLKCSHYFLVIAQKSQSKQYINYLQSNNIQYFPKTLDSSNKIVHLCDSLDDYKQLFTYQHYLSIEPRGREDILHRWSHSSTQYNSSIIIFGGFGSTKHSRLNNICIVNTLNWNISSPSIIGKAPSPRIFSTLSYWKDDKCILFGGREGTSKPYNDCYLLSIDSLTWDKISYINSSDSSIPFARWRHTANIINDLMFIIGGCNQNNIFSCNPYVFNIQDKIWKEYSISIDSIEYPEPRHSHTCTLIDNNKLLLIGGLNNKGIPLDDIWIMNINFELCEIKWEKINIINPIARYSHSIIKKDNNDNKYLLIGGVGKYLQSNNELIMVLDLDNNKWENIMSLELPEGTMLNKQTSHYINNTLILIGGGGNCFSFGSHFNKFISIYSSKMIQKQEKQEKIIDNKKSINRLLNIKVESQDISIESYDNITKDDFLTYTNRKDRKPFIIKNNNLGECLNKWNNGDYLKKKCGEKLVSIHKCDNRYFDFVTKNYSYIVESFSNLIDNTFNQDINDNYKYYLRSIGDNPRRDPSDIWKSYPEIIDDFKIPLWFPYSFPNHDKYFSSVLRIGSKNMQLWTHYDMMDNILCHIKGIKHITLWPPYYANRMYLHGSTSEVIHINDPDYKKYPLFPYNQGIKITLYPGDILFIPALWFHNVYSEDICISINIFWRELSNDYYEKKDLFGNKDLSHGLIAFNHIDNIKKELETIPETYRDFYGRLAISKLLDLLNNPL